jgi:hypothetical protein
MGMQYVRICLNRLIWLSVCHCVVGHLHPTMKLHYNLRRSQVVFIREVYLLRLKCHIPTYVLKSSELPKPPINFFHRHFHPMDFQTIKMMMLGFC